MANTPDDENQKDQENSALINMAETLGGAIGTAAAGLGSLTRNAADAVATLRGRSGAPSDTGAEDDSEDTDIIDVTPAPAPARRLTASSPRKAAKKPAAKRGGMKAATRATAKKGTVKKAARKAAPARGVVKRGAAKKGAAKKGAAKKGAAQKRGSKKAAARRPAKTARKRSARGRR